MTSKDILSFGFKLNLALELWLDLKDKGKDRESFVFNLAFILPSIKKWYLAAGLKS